MILTIKADDMNGVNLQLTALESKYSSVKVVWQRKVGAAEVAKVKVIDRKDESWKI